MRRKLRGASFNNSWFEGDSRPIGLSMASPGAELALAEYLNHPEDRVAIRISDPGPDVKSGLALSCRSHRQMRERVREAEKIGHNEAVKVLVEILFKKPSRV